MAYFHPPEDFNGKTDQEILASMHANAFESDHYKHCMNTLQLRYMQRTVKATGRLVIATWGLDVATGLLLLGSVLQLLKD